VSHTATVPESVAVASDVGLSLEKWIYLYASSSPSPLGEGGGPSSTVCLFKTRFMKIGRAHV
jgi:hypothetical protein